MKKLLYFIVFPIIVVALGSCNHENYDEIDFDQYFTGKWEMVGENHYIYDISRVPSSGSYLGKITTYHLIDGDHPQYASEYSWSIYNPDGHAPQLELIKRDELNKDDPWAGSYYYTIIKLNDTEMWWESHTLSGKEIIKFVRWTSL